MGETHGQGEATIFPDPEGVKLPRHVAIEPLRGSSPKSRCALEEPQSQSAGLRCKEPRTHRRQRDVCATREDADLFKPWSLLMGGKAIFTLPRIEVYRTHILNHTVHHRAQLGVYLRLNDVPVPATYGPTADEN